MMDPANVIIFVFSLSIIAAAIIVYGILETFFPGVLAKLTKLLGFDSEDEEEEKESHYSHARMVQEEAAKNDKLQ